MSEAIADASLGALAGGLLGGIVGSFIPGGTLLGALYGAQWGASIGGYLGGASEKEKAAAAQSAQNSYTISAAQSSTASVNNLRLQQDAAAIRTLQANQQDKLNQYKAMAATAEGAQTQKEQNDYAQAFGAIGSAEQRIGAEQGSMASGASTLVSNYAARGIRIAPGDLESAMKAGQASSLTAEQGINGTGAGEGTAAVTAVAGANATPGAAAVEGVQGAPAIAAVPGTAAVAAIDGTSGTPVTAAQAANPMRLSVTNSNPNISPLAQLASYEKNANLAIQNEMTNVALVGNASLRGIADQAANFETNAAQNLLGFQTMQAQNLGAAQTNLVNNQNLAALGEDISARQGAAEISFTATNLANYDASLWLSAFQNIASDAFSVMGMMFGKTKNYYEQQPSLKFSSFNGQYWGISAAEPKNNLYGDW